MIKALLFDLDGTLLNTLADLADAVNRTMRKHGYAEHPQDAYRFFVGCGMEKLIIRALPEQARTPQVIADCKRDFMEDYGKNWMNATALYPGIAELLDNLQQNGIHMAVLSNKPHEMTKKCVETYMSSWAFDAVIGQIDGIPVKPDPSSANRIVKLINAKSDEFLYVGDSSVDMRTAAAADMTAVGVTWGFRPKKELIDNGARYIIDHPSELAQIITSHTTQEDK
ncbi:MAG: HAD family hydrolase [Spartobacteria bacterium]|nr:HAD family hydrolase [Spartobacteria bacterium]